jgi:hypothetical protein
MQLGKKRKRKMPDEAMEIGYLADLFYLAIHLLHG